jgi:chromosome segregation ATPase
MRRCIKAAVLVAIIFAIAYVLTGCTGSKNINRSLQMVDSSYAQDLEQQIRVLNSEIESLRTKISEMEYIGVQFDNNCDSLYQALQRAGCNTDSINAVISLYRSKVKFYADGAFEVEGNLKSLTRTKSRLEETVKSLQRKVDSLATVKNKVDVRYEKTTETKEKIVKRGISAWWLLLVVIAFLIGFWLCWKYKDAIQEQLDAEQT